MLTSGGIGALAVALAASPVVVLDADGAALSDDERALLGAEVTHALSARGVPEVLGEADLAAMLDVEARRQQTGCGDASCAAEIADAMGAERVVASRVTQSAEGFTWHLIVVDARAARVLARSEVRAPSAIDLARAAPDAVAPLADALGAPFQVPFVVWPVSLGAGALTLAAVGLATDALAPTSRNGKLDVTDAIGPTCYVAAAGLAVGAVLVVVLAEDR